VTGVDVQERVPDRILRQADTIVNVDLPSAELQERLRAGKIYPKERIAPALENFFTEENLASLRELAMRQIADRLEAERRGPHATAATEPVGTKAMVAMSSNPETTRLLLRRASALAGKLNTNWFAVYVRTPGQPATHVGARMSSQNVTSRWSLGGSRGRRGRPGSCAGRELAIFIAPSGVVGEGPHQPTGSESVSRDETDVLPCVDEQPQRRVCSVWCNRRPAGEVEPPACRVLLGQLFCKGPALLVRWEPQVAVRRQKHVRRGGGQPLEIRGQTRGGHAVDAESIRLEEKEGAGCLRNRLAREKPALSVSDERQNGRNARSLRGCERRGRLADRVVRLGENQVDTRLGEEARLRPVLALEGTLIRREIRAIAVFQRRKRARHEEVAPGDRRGLVGELNRQRVSSPDRASSPTFARVRAWVRNVFAVRMSAPAPASSP
jgi:hypothetical protein